MKQVWDELEGDSFYPAAEKFEEEKKQESSCPSMASTKRDRRLDSYVSMSTIYERRPVTHSLKSQDSSLNLWKGLTPSLLLCSNPAINYTVFDIVKSRILDQRHSTKLNLSMMDAFLLGLLAKFVATITTYPLIRAKVMLMVTDEKSMLACLCRSYKEEGVHGLYKGCDWQLLHTILKSALMMMVKEKIEASTIRLIVGTS